MKTLEQLLQEMPDDKFIIYASKYTGMDGRELIAELVKRLIKAKEAKKVVRIES